MSCFFFAYVKRAVTLTSPSRAVSQSLPPIPHLESVYRHTSASIRLLGDMGVGAAAMVDVREEVLGKRAK
jgi:hypothetical protein